MAKKPKAAKRRKPNPAALDVLLSNPDILKHLMAALGGHSAQAPTFAEQLKNYLALYTQPEGLEDGDQEMSGRAEDLQSLLTDLRVEVNSGNRAAREELEEGLAIVEAAAESGDLPGHAIVALFQIFGLAEVDPGDALRDALLARLEDVGEPSAPAPPSRTPAADDLSVMDEETSQAMFAAMMRYMPKSARHNLVRNIGGQAQETARAILIGCLLDFDPDLVRIAVEGLIASARSTPVPSRLVERLVLIRGLVPIPMHRAVDSAIAALRPKASAPVAREPLQLVKCVASICDGAGAQSLIALMRRGKTHVMVTFMVKTHLGFIDALVLDGFSKRKFDKIVKGEMGIDVVAVSLEVVQRRLAIALSTSHTNSTFATFGFVRALETLGIAALRPDTVEPEALLDEFLAENAPLVPVTLAEAAVRLDDSGLVETWFEAGPDCDKRLDRLRGVKQRHKAALAYIEERRGFWAAQCANSALILRDSGKPLGPRWYDFTILGKHFASREPLAENPLAGLMAKSTVEAHRGQMYR